MIQIATRNAAGVELRADYLPVAPPVPGVRLLWRLARVHVHGVEVWSPPAERSRRSTWNERPFGFLTLTDSPIGGNLQ